MSPETTASLFGEVRYDLEFRALLTPYLCSLGWSPCALSGQTLISQCPGEQASDGLHGLTQREAGAASPPQGDDDKGCTAAVKGERIPKKA